jgi:hypothetical protein
MITIHTHGMGEVESIKKYSLEQHTMTASGEANMETRDAMLTLPTNSCRTGWSNKAMLACAMSANAKTTSTRSPVILSCGGTGEQGPVLLVSDTARCNWLKSRTASKAIELHTRVVLLSA